MKTILLFGASGMLGSAVNAVNPTACTVLARSSYDFMDAASLEVAVKYLKPDIVINCAAMTNVDACEKDYDRCFLVNARAPGVIASTCHSVGARMVHISTDFVFDGRLPLDRRYTRLDVPTIPERGLYATAKFRAERAVMENCPDSIIIRSSWLFGGNRMTYPDWIVQRARECRVARTPLELIIDRFGSPSYAPDVASAVMDLALGGRHGVVHAVNRQDDPVSQATYGHECLRAADLDDFSFVIAHATQDDLVSRGTWNVRRPVNSGLVSDVPLRDWREALSDYLTLKQSLENKEN